MTTNQYLGMGLPNEQGRYELCLRRKGQPYKNMRCIASFPTHEQMLYEWARVTDLEGMVDVNGSIYD